VGMVPYPELNIPAPMAYAMERIGAPWWIRVSIDVGAVLGIGSVILVMLLGQSRVFYSMSRDGLLGRWAGQVHPRFRTPYLSTIYTGIAVCFATGLLPLQLLGTWVRRRVTVSRDAFVLRLCSTYSVVSTYLIVMLNGVPVPPERARAAQTVAAVLTPGRRIALTTHVNADGDGVGSEVALWHLLTARGLKPAIANPTPVPER